MFFVLGGVPFTPLVVLWVNFLVLVPGWRGFGVRHTGPGSDGTQAPAVKATHSFPFAMGTGCITWRE